MIVYVDSVKGIREDQLQGFFVGWRKVPPPSVHVDVLRNSDYVILARDSETEKQSDSFPRSLTVV